MARIKAAVNAHKKRRKVLKLAKGYYGAKSKQYRAASEQVARSLRYAYEGRKMRKRDLRRRSSEWHELQRADGWSEEEEHPDQPQDAG